MNASKAIGIGITPRCFLACEISLYLKIGKIINVTSGGKRVDITGFRPAGLDGSNRVGDWLDILGRGNLLSGRTTLSPYRMGESGGPGLDRFGYVSLAGKSEYKLTDRLLLRGIAGRYGRPRRRRVPRSCGSVCQRPPTQRAVWTRPGTSPATADIWGRRWTCTWSTPSCRGW